jgi:ketosteroid isomerase-like protein
MPTDILETVGRNFLSDLDAQFAHVWWLEGGKITRFQQYADSAQVLGATGQR